MRLPEPFSMFDLPREKLGRPGFKTTVPRFSRIEVAEFTVPFIHLKLEKGDFRWPDPVNDRTNRIGGNEWGNIQLAAVHRAVFK